MGILIPGFFGYYNAYRGLLVNQAGLQVVNNNITNSNTPGYSKQSVDISNGDAYPPASIGNVSRYGQIGEGPKMTGISRSHDNYIDTQIRNNQSALGYQSQLQNILGQIENTLNEPSNSGLSAAMQTFFDAAQAMSNNPDNLATRASFMTASQGMLQSFQNVENQLQTLRTNLVGNANVTGSFQTSQAYNTVASINDKLSQLADVQDKIIAVNASGGQPNNLLDTRDQILENLSKQLNITVVPHNENNLVDVKIGNTFLVRGNGVKETLSAVENDGSGAFTTDDVPTVINLTNAGTTINTTITGGSLGGILKMGSNDTGITTLRGMMVNLDTLFGQIATQVNTLQAGGLDYNGNAPVSPDDAIFSLNAGTGLDVFNYTINQNLVTDPKLLAAADGAGAFAGVGDGRNAQAIATLQNTALAGLGSMTVSEFLNTQVSRLGLDSNSATNNVNSFTDVYQQLDQRRQSVQGVNIEEEMLDLLRFQRGFEAASKSLITLDKAMDTIINKLI